MKRTTVLLAGLVRFTPRRPTLLRGPRSGEQVAGDTGHIEAGGGLLAFRPACQRFVRLRKFGKVVPHFGR